MEKVLKEIIEGTANTYGEMFFEKIIEQLDKVIHSDYTFIGQLNKVDMTCQTIALINKGKKVNDFIYPLQGTPCKNVANNSICFYPDKITELYPEDQVLINMNIRGYIGTPLHDSKGDVMGIIVALYKEPIIDKSLTLTLFQLFSSRISGEFERLEREKDLIELNKNLDLKIKVRTAELEKSVINLKKAHDQLVETEKLAMLGDLVAGVAHEVNTPLGIAITAESHLSEIFESFQEKLSSEHLSLKDMNHFVEQHQQCLPMISRNLQRSKEIIDNFKCMATEQSEFNLEPINIHQYYQRLVTTLSPLLKRKQVQVNLSGCEKEFTTTYPGCHAQILTNLVNNSILHGFSNHEGNTITIKITNENDKFTIDYFDNGTGISGESETKVFEPFYTTTRNKGNCGLGLSISHNLVVTSLKGSLIMLSSDKGVHFRYTFQSC